VRSQRHFIKPISLEHILENTKLDFHHRDPFDRIIIAQAIRENLTVITKDEQFKHYPEKSCVEEVNDAVLN